MARLRSDFWVSAYLRQRALAGVPAVLRRRGAAQAGAIFIKVDCLDGRARLFSPAPLPDLSTASGSDAPPPARHFACALEADALAVEDRIARELRYDGDLWLVEVEDRGGDPGLPA
jgi:hypothetical protein